MRRFVKVLEINRIVNDLINRAGGKFLLTDFELNHKDYVINQQDDIDPSSETRNGVLKVNFSSRDIGWENGSQYAYLFNPSIPLRVFNRKLGMPRDCAENLFGASAKKLFD